MQYLHSIFNNTIRFGMQEQVKNTKVKEYCSVPYCDDKENNNLHFHRPPENKKLFKKWLIALKMKKLTSAMRVCSKHFVASDYFPTANPNAKRILKKNAVPTQNIPVTLTCEKKKNVKLVAQRKLRIQMRTERKAELAEAKSDVNVLLFDQIENNVLQVKDSNIEKFHFNDIIGNDSMPMEYFSCSSYNGDDCENNQISLSKCDQSTQTEPYEQFGNASVLKNIKKLFVLDLLDSDKKLFSFTGIQSYLQLNAMEKCIEVLRTTVKKKQIAIPIQQSIILAFMKLKQNLSYTVISILFGISIKLAKKYFIHTLHELCTILSPQIRWPSKDEILDNMPKCFQKFRSTRIVLDCLEISMRRSKCLKCRIPTFSTYKSNHTVKFMIGVTPSGLISFLSKAYGGRVSDKQIFNRSKLLEKMKRSVDSVMVDKGFLIDRECAEYDIKLFRPPFKRKSMQLSGKEADRTRDIAAARVHVERRIQRVRQWEIVRGYLANEIVPYINMIMKIICGMSNLQSPILSENKFLTKM